MLTPPIPPSHNFPQQSMHAKNKKELSVNVHCFKSKWIFLECPVKQIKKYILISRRITPNKSFTQNKNPFFLKS